MARKGLYMCSTEISTEESAARISTLLARAGACSVMQEYDGFGSVEALAFRIKRDGEIHSFRLPARWEGTLEAMKADRKTQGRYCNEAQARRTSWRLILRWVEAQLALIECSGVPMIEIMLPYMQIGTAGETVYQVFEKKGLPQLGYVPGGGK